MLLLSASARALALGCWFFLASAGAPPCTTCCSSWPLCRCAQGSFYSTSKECHPLAAAFGWQSTDAGACWPVAVPSAWTTSAAFQFWAAHLAQRLM